MVIRSGVRLHGVKGVLHVLLRLLVLAATAQAEVRFTGQVQTPNYTPLPGVRVWLECEECAERIQRFSDSQGQFVLPLPLPGIYRLYAEREGYFPAQARRITIGESSTEVTLTLEPVRERIDSVDVRAVHTSIDMDSTSSRRMLTSRDLVNIPYPNTNDFRGALRAVPGVVRDARGGLHVNGSSEEQVQFNLNGFNLNDPLTGRFSSRLSVESVENVELTSGNPAAEIGKGAGGLLAIQTHTGDDKIRYSATNFFPGVENRKGWIIGNWTPRFEVSGPLRRGRTWFSNSSDIQYVKTVVRDLPVGQDRSVSRGLSNLLHLQHNVTPANILTGSFLVNLTSAARTGLTALDPVETTIDRRTRQWFFNVKDQIFLGNRTVMEIGFAANRTFGRDIPQGHSMLSITPSGKRGNFFVDGLRTASRNQIIASIVPAPVSWRGTHYWKVGIDLDRLGYFQDVRRSGFENLSESGYRTSRTVFAGSGRLSKSNDEGSLFVQDSWRVRQNLLLETGARGDWDRILHRWSASPRLGVAWSPPRSDNTKISAGMAWISDATNLRIFTRPLDQYTLTNYYSPNDQLVRGPSLSIYSIGNAPLLRPAYRLLSLGAAHRWRQGILVRADYARRRGSSGFTYLNSNLPDSPNPDWLPNFHAVQLDAAYQLTNHRTDAFDSITVTVRHSFRERWEWLAAYTRSRALSNAVVDVSVEDPIIVTTNVGPMPWDAPHRFQSWGYLPLPRKDWALAFLLDTRSGFPFSLQGGDGRILGAVNSERFPFYFELNVHVERKFVFRGHHWAWRFGCNNITGRINPDTVNNFVSSSRYRQFYGGSGRAVNMRIRWLGRAAR
ncbi:MAG: TonB-dependent receptor [Candidatus Solibacter usitatus]|nr:TonB-dependent receptor [Candidatus Solibacter usitatus]